MHAGIAKLDVESVLSAGPIPVSSFFAKLCWLFIAIGLLTFTVGVFAVEPGHFWGAYYTSFWFFTGLALGGVILAAIFQIVRAQWSPPVRRVAEANIAFLPWAYLFFVLTWAGRRYLFPWADHPMPGRETWMSPGFVYGRFAVLLAVLFYLLWRFVRLSLRSDAGMIRERLDRRQGAERWVGLTPLYDFLTSGWRGLATEAGGIQRRLSVMAPVMIIAYAIIVSLFSFEMLMAMDPWWYSNMFGGFIFVGNIYIGFAATALTTVLLAKFHRPFAATISSQQLWDLGKMTFAFCMFWGYLFLCQFLPQWYGNLPEETQWLILRTRDWDLPWIRLAWFVFPMCFVIPFILLLSRDLKRTPFALGLVCVIILLGVWLEKYLIIMPNMYQEVIPLGATEAGLFLGFLGVYALSVRSFLAKFPFLPISHPLTHGSTDW